LALISEIALRSLLVVLLLRDLIAKRAAFILHNEVSGNLRLDGLFRETIIRNKVELVLFALDEILIVFLIEVVHIVDGVRAGLLGLNVVELGLLDFAVTLLW
jgi:hypothetical protein